jgi:branched-chain amino acid transport system substrate-binding protein
MLQLSRILVMAGASALALAFAGTAAHAQKKYDPGASDTEIRIGNTNPYSGPASAYGTIGKAMDAFFKKVNDEGGINKRKITFISYDDAYAPPKTVEMVTKLVESDKVLFVFQTLGTIHNQAVQKYLNNAKVPQVFVATGSAQWGNYKQNPWTIGFQPNYVMEGNIYGKYVVDNVKDPKIAVLMQNDDYGREYLNAFKQGLGKAADKIVQVAAVEVRDPTVDSQMITLKNTGANVFFNITTPRHAAQAIKKAGEMGWKPLHILNNVSASVGKVIKPAGFEHAQGIITAAYLKDPTDPQWQKDKDFQEWTAFMKKYYPTGSVLDGENAYAYAVSSLLVQLLKQAGDDLTRANIMKQAANLKDIQLPMIVPGIKVNTSATDFYPIQSVQMARFKGQTYELFGSIISHEGATH